MPHFLILRERCPYHSKQTAGRAHSSHADGAGICQVWWHEEPQRCCSPFQQQATLPSDSSRERRSGWKRQKLLLDFNHTSVYESDATFHVWEIRCCWYTCMSVYLWCKVVLLQLPALPQIPGADRVIQAPGPQLGAIVGDVDAAGSICVALKLSVKHTCRFLVK